VRIPRARGGGQRPGGARLVTATAPGGTPRPRPPSPPPLRGISSAVDRVETEGSLSGWGLHPAGHVHGIAADRVATRATLRW